MKQSVMIKGSPSGLTVYLDKELPYAQLKKELAVKFKEASGFFKSARMAVCFEGRPLDSSEQIELVEIIMSNSDIRIACVVDQDTEKEAMFQSHLARMESRSAQSADENLGQFYKGTLLGGQVLETEGSVIILGDVNPGGKVIAKGNVVVLGALKGTAYAGISGNEKAFVAALDMEAMQIRIGDIIARCADGKNTSRQPVPKIAYVDNGSIYVETICKEVLNEIYW